MNLRPYQSAALDELRARIAGGARRLVLTCPTGGGKTVIAAEIVRSAVARGSRVVFLAHRKELIDQTLDKLSRFGVEAGVVMGDDSRRASYLPVQVCSTPTLANRLDRLPPADLVIYDEVHHACSNTSRKILAAYGSAVVIGLTATPWRRDRLGLSDMFDGSVLAAKPRELMDQGSLVEYDCFAYDAPDLDEVRTTAGDFNQKDLGVACNTDVLVGSVVREYLEHANGRRAILFPVNVEHSKTLVAEFCSFGVAAEHVDAHTPKPERERILRGLDSGAVTLVSSVGVLTEGFDSPRAEVCILARPTKSLGLYIQMIGRVLRPAPGKARALIHCHSGNVLRHGFIEDDRDYSLTATPKNVLARKTCPECSVVFATLRDGRFCPGCDALLATPTCKHCLRETRPHAPVAGLDYCDCDLESIARGEKVYAEGRRIDIAEIRARRAKFGFREMSDKEIVRVATASRDDMAAEYLRLCAVAEQKKFQPGFVAHQFRETFGHWPRFTDAELDAAEPARAPFVKLPPRQARAA